MMVRAAQWQLHHYGCCLEQALATVGFGDITPVTTEGRMAIMVFIMVAGILIPSQTLKLVSLVNSHSRMSAGW
jgi:hypothetical protein